MALPDGSVAVVESMASRVSRVSPNGAVSLIAETGGGPNGMALDAAARMLVANNGGIGHPVRGPGSIQRVEPDGRLTTLVANLDAPNDICLGPGGAVWFTDPRDNWFQRVLRPGRVFRWDGSLQLIHEGLDYPNGIGVDAAGRVVVAESRTGLLHVLADGEPDVWARCPVGAPDGFCFDAEGRCFVCCFDAARIIAIEPEGRVSETLHTGEGTMPTNCAITREGSLVFTEAAQGLLMAFDLGLSARLRVPG